MGQQLTRHQQRTGPVSGSSPGWTRRLFQACWQHPRILLICLSSALIGVGLQAAGPLLIANAVDNAIARNTNALPWIISTLAAVAVIVYAAAYIRRYYGARVSLSVQHDLRGAIFASLQRLDGNRQDSLRTGQVVSTAITDLQVVGSLLSMTPLALGQLVLIVLAFGAMVWLSPLLTLVVLFAVISAGIIAWFSKKRLHSATQVAQQRAGDVAQHIEEAITGVRVVKGFGQESREISGLANAAERLYSARIRSAKLAAKPNAMLSVLPVLGQVAVLGLGGWLALQGKISLGVFLAFASYVSILIGPSRLFASLIITSQLARASTERVYDLLDSQPSIQDVPDARPLPEGPLGITFDQVTFGYHRDEPVLRQISLDIAPGETVAIVGPAGSGKSTISLLISRFYDVHKGSIRITTGEESLDPASRSSGTILDPASRSSENPIGLDIRQVQIASLRKAMGVVFEEAFLFSASVKENIAYGRPNATDAEIEAAAKAAEAHDFITDLPDGYHTVIGERGLTLSGGQRQRIALARALLLEPRILLLDDATSAVDPLTEAAIHATLKTVTAARTTILIAHRKSTLSLADRIAVLDHGKIVDFGTQEELAKRCSLFQKLLASHSDNVDEVPAAPLDSDLTFHASGITRELWPEKHPETSISDETVQNSASGPLVDSKAAEKPRLRNLNPREDASSVRIVNLIKPIRGILLVAMLCLAIDTTATIVLPHLFRYGVDAGIQTGSPGPLWTVLFIGIGTVIISTLAITIQTVSTSRAGETLLYALRIRTFAHLQRLGLDYYERELSGRIMTRMTTDLDAMSNFLQTGLVITVISALTMAGVTVSLIVTEPSLALVALAILPIAAISTLIYQRKVGPAYAKSRERIATVNADLQENVSGLRVVQAFSREEYSAQVFTKHGYAYRRARLHAQRHVVGYFQFISFLTDIAQVVVLAVGTYRVAAGTLTPGVLLAFLLYLGLFFGPLQQLSGVFDSYRQARVGLDRVTDLLRIRPSMVEPSIPRALPDRLSGDIEIREVSFRYPESDRFALRKISLQINAGETIAFVGATGAGKSTLIKLLGRFYEASEGVIVIDGVDIREYRLADYRHRLGVVPQEAHLFTGDVASNISYGRPESSPRDIEAAARRVGALPIIADLPMGFRQPTGERGQGLSAGQRQIVALARAELVDPDILLLDEATAALDPATEAAVLTASDRLMRERTTFIVAHRLATAARADRIVVIADGQIIEQGSHAELLKRKGSYAQLWASGVTIIE